MAHKEKLSNESIKKELSRVPRSLSDLKNDRLFSDTSTNGGSLMTDILIYCSNYRMKDLFGNIRFSIDDFCDKMGYSKSNLQRKLSSEQLKQIFGKEVPVYRVPLTGQREYLHTIESLFEVMLYKLTKENIVHPVAMPDGSTRYTSINIIKYFEISDNFETEKRTKRMYTVSLSSEIQNLLYTNYNLIELNDYANIPDRKGYKRFYLILARMIFIIKYNIQLNNEASYLVSIDQLAVCFDIKETEEKIKKRKVINFLNRINNYLTNTKFSFVPIVGEGQKWAYTIKFEFDEDVLRFFDEKYKAVFTARYYKELQYLYMKTNFPEIGVHLYHIKIKEIIDEPIDNKKMIDWIFSNDLQEEKEKLYDKIFYQTYGKTPQEMDVNINFRNELKGIIELSTDHINSNSNKDL